MQASFSKLEHAVKIKRTRRDRSLAEIDAFTPWALLAAAIDSYYPKANGRGRRPIGLEPMLRMYVVQQCFGMSGEAIEDALYDSPAIRRFVRIDLAREAAPDATTLLKFRSLLAEHKLTNCIFQAIKAHPADKGLLFREGRMWTPRSTPPRPLDQEPQAQRCFRHAPDEEGQPGALRHEGEHRGERGIGIGSYGGKRRRPYGRRPSRIGWSMERARGFLMRATRLWKIVARTRRREPLCTW
jgi:hypothetical protein